MSSKAFTNYARVVFMATLLWSNGGQADELAIPDFPLFLTSAGVPPNLIMTIDDSLSMQYHFAPENVDDITGSTLPRFASPSVNGMYYNPKITYKIPTRSDSVAYTTSFDKAWFNGFDQNMGPANGLNFNNETYRVVKGSTAPETSYSSLSASSFIGTTEKPFYYMFYLDIPVDKPTEIPFSDFPVCPDNDRNNKNCYIKVEVGSATDITIGGGTSDERKQNFANWYSFYRNRALATMSGAMIAMAGVKEKSIRFGWQTIDAQNDNKCPIDPGTDCPSYTSTSTSSAQSATCNVTFDYRNPTDRRIDITNTSGTCRTFFSGITAGSKVNVTGATTSFSHEYTVSSPVEGDSSAIQVSGETFLMDKSFSNVGLQWNKITIKIGTATYQNRLKVLDSDRKTNFYNWLARMTVKGYTPTRGALKRVGQYYQTSNSPYADNPNEENEGTLRSCRKNFHVLFTDGRWNSVDADHDYNYTAPGSDNQDSFGTTLLGAPTKLTDDTVIDSYTPRSPYQDQGKNPKTYKNEKSLSDTALFYWATDLRSDLENNVSTSTVDLTGTETDQFWNPKNDPATWQHMVNYTIGLGLSASLVPQCLYYTGSTPTKDPNNPNCPSWGGSVYSGDYDKLVSGDRNWPQINQRPSATNEPDGHVYELWHMAINSRGKFYNADDPAQLTKAFQDVMDTISSIANAGGGSRVSTNVTSTEEVGATAFVAGFNADWSGKLEARPLNEDGTFGTIGTPPDVKPYRWEAGRLIPPGNNLLPRRKIFTRNSGTAQEFASCTGDLQTALNTITKKDPVTGNDVTTTDNLCPQRLAWLRGYTAITGASTWDSVNQTITFTAPNHGLQAQDSVVVTGVTVTGDTSSVLNQTYEVLSATSDSFTVRLNTNPGGSYVTDEVDTDRSNDDRVRYAAFRDRSSVLGDIVSSGTVYVHQDNFGYGGDLIAVDGGGSTYKAYVEGKASKPPVIYVGANDGMVHAFNAKTDVAEGGGQELFAYVPAGVYGNLSALTDPAYGKSHKFFVDGTPTVGDAYIGGWKTYLVGGLRKGGKSIYALDITDPVNFSATNVKWEFKDDNDLGFTFGQPQIAAVSANQWAAIFGNGYNSTNGNAVLYIVDLSSGVDTKITVPSSPYCTSNALATNGLSTPYAFDKTGDGIVDVIYAGDLLGRLWRFDKSSGSWKVGNDNQPLFTACNASNQAQSITAQPKAALIESKTIVYFGTGRYLIADPNDPTNKTRNDLLNSDVQSFYSIVDESDYVDEDGDFTKQGTVPRDKLLPQTIEDTVTVGSYKGRIVSNHKVTDTDYIGRDRGCYLDFTTTPAGEPSERITSGALIRTFKSADLPTRFIFVTSVPTSDPCAKSGISWLMELGTNCGRLEGASPFDLNGDDKFDKNDLVSIGGEDATVSGLQLNVQTGLVNEITTIGGPSSDPDHGIFYKLLPGTSGKVEKVSNSDDKPPSGGGLTPKRIYWEQIQ